MAVLRIVLAVAALTLPASRRDRWREETLAVLAEVQGVRRWWFALDTAVKAPMLARQLRVPVPPPGRWLSVLTGAALIGASVVMAVAVLFPSAIGEDAAEFLFLCAPCGMAGVVAARSVATARSYGGGPVPYLMAVVVTVFAGTGPIAAGALSVVTGVAAIAMIGAVVPGVWLIGVSAAALVRRTSPAALAVSGALTGAGLLGVLLGLQLVTHVAAIRQPASALTATSLLVLIPAWTVWSTWTAARLIRGRSAQRLV